MKAGVITFPGSNCDRDLAEAFRKAGASVVRIWHKETSLPDGLDVIGVPGGFSFGDYLRCGAIAARSPVTQSVVEFASKGGYVIGICNGFQVLCETGLLPGALIRNAGLTFVCRPQRLRVVTSDSAFTRGFNAGTEVTFPIAHHDGNYIIDQESLAQLEAEDRIALRYLDNPNGSVGDIAGVLSENRRVIGMMPHPERVVEPVHGGTDGAVLFSSIIGATELA